MYLPKDGDVELNILSKNVIELSYCYTRPTNTSPLKWNFVAGGTFTQPNTLSVSVNGIVVGTSSMSFKRRPSYVPLKSRDLRIMNWITITLNTSLVDGQTVTVSDSSKSVLVNNISTVVNQFRVSPVIHVNQVGYAPNFNKTAIVGYYIGNGGELDVSNYTSFSLINTQNQVVFTGSLSLKKDVGYAYTPIPYQKVLVADFSSFNQTGKYRVFIDGIGTSLSFNIHDGVFMNFARTIALGLLNQRCGYKVSKPYSRHEHNKCHTTAEIPLPASNYPETWAMIAGESSIKSPADLYFPYNKSGSIDITGSTHDAGDYSRYLQNVGSHLHSLIFSVDLGLSFDNLGLPESGNNINDLLELAKWEADWLLKMQDTDGGFFILVYPKTRPYELDNSLQGTNVGDSLVVWPKNTIATAISVGALAEIGSSPKFRQTYEATIADTYLTAAKNGWVFLMNAITKYGLTTSYQQIRGGDSDHTAALCYAASSLFTATNDSQYSTKLYTWLPDSNNVPWQWGWKVMYGYYGCAIRNYAFSVKSGKLKPTDLNTTYLSGCENQIIKAGDNCLRDSNSSAYGACVSYDNKNYAGSSFGWYFLTEDAFNLVAAHNINQKPDYVKAGILTYNYLIGCNPINVSSLSGIGQKRPRIFVNNYQLNDFRTMPPNGQFRASISAGATYLDKYVNPDNTNELNNIIFPEDHVLNNKYQPEDRYIDQFNVMDEETVAPVNVRGLVFACWLANMNSYKSQPYVPK